MESLKMFIEFKKQWLKEVVLDKNQRSIIEKELSNSIIEWKILVTQD